MNKQDNKKLRRKTKTIKVDYLARVEGEGSLAIKLKNEQLSDVKLKIFEPPRFFEAFLRGRDFREAPDITARICGICPIAYQLGASNAMEDVCGVEIPEPIRLLRRLIYCGEWIESHVLHMYMLHAPDFLGYQDAIRMAKDHPDVVQRGLRMKKIGNDIMSLLGGREIHPINLKVGGFYGVPTKPELETLVDDLKWGLEASHETLKWLATLPFPNFDQLVSNKGIDVPIREYDNHLIEAHVQHSTALHTIVKDRDACFLGPLARYSINFDKLSSTAQQAARDAGLEPVCRNPFKSIMVRGVETLYAFEEALRLIDKYERPEQPAMEVEPKAGTGYGATEAPRGICYHHYTLDDDGTILDAKIVSPTAVNQKTIESDLWHYIPPNIDLPEEKLQWQCEQAIRNYDPCISCSTHFLKLKVDREP
ncbi:Ni/Fe hydrogenase subunit alpha [candidate division KSB1 bacterium]|nr:Ni/Fe hydrogenase subunit alpha [candidate division KSB1 bacterium]NIR72785.1 Ni/Fe hydrogenase subunit alpha [candidate division KSB1 bacterium]NIS23741.1 Ni/Fe hydrogenase subunit alpha [candidate division KSB1 bacterium]NIT70662.1 Ni/Fe hydrogenase subunit alpha [candidate division KSB1 bacterium]NIU24389.1 Ni/Fe hydrogenase subunit alpha [candidate division KSB1 bacterium]